MIPTEPYENTGHKPRVERLEQAVQIFLQKIGTQESMMLMREAFDDGLDVYEWRIKAVRKADGQFRVEAHCQQRPHDFQIGHFTGLE